MMALLGRWAALEIARLLKPKKDRDMINGFLCCLDPQLPGVILDVNRNAYGSTHGAHPWYVDTRDLAGEWYCDGVSA